MVNAPETLVEIQRDLARAIKLLELRAPAYKKAREYYDGTRAEVAGSRVAETIIEQSKATPVNFAHIPVDAIVEKVELTGIAAALPGATDVLTRWADANDLDDESEDWTRKVGMFGDYYVIIDPTAEEEVTGNVAPEDIDTVGLSPLSTVMIYDKKTGRRALYGAHVWDEGENDTRAILYYDDVSVMLASTSDDAHSRQASDFDYDVKPGEDEASARLPHAGGRPLLKHVAIGGKPYGVPLHRRAWGFQDAITKISANNLVNVDAMGLPSRWALIDPTAEIDDDIDDDFGTDGPGSALTTKADGQTTATAGKVRTVPGTIKMLRGVKQTGTYDAGDTSGFLTNLDWYVRAMAVATGVPLFEFDLNGEQPSGEARRRAEARSNRRARSVQRQMTGLLAEVAETVLALAGQAESAIEVTFAPVETQTDADGIALVAEKVKVGVPIRTALTEAGYTTDQVDEWFPEAEVARLSPALLSVIAEILSKLGSAKTLGVITQDQIAAMLPDLLPAVAAPEGPVVTDAEIDAVLAPEPPAADGA
jgi:hypothetical protein